MCASTRAANDGLNAGGIGEQHLSGATLGSLVGLAGDPQWALVALATGVFDAAIAA